MQASVSRGSAAEFLAVDYVHPFEMTHEQRQELTAQTHERIARAFARVGDQSNAASALRCADLARSVK